MARTGEDRFVQEYKRVKLGDYIIYWKITYETDGLSDWLLEWKGSDYQENKGICVDKDKDFVRSFLYILAED